MSMNNVTPLAGAENFEVCVRVTQVLEPQSFTRRDGTPMTRHAFVGETQGQYPKTFKFDVMGAEKYAAMNIVVGNIYSVSFDVSSREWYGKWFTSLTAWRVTLAHAEQPAQPQTVAVAQESAAPERQEADDGLPF